MRQGPVAGRLPAATFAERIEASVRGRASRICLGIDPRPLDHPLMAGIGGEVRGAAVAERVVRFYCEVLQGAHEQIACVKPQSAFFEALGVAGSDALARLMEEARLLDLPVILDAKRGDIGSTAEAYADAYLGEGELAADALTVSPYPGFDTLQPFVEAAARHGRGVFVLVATSNPGAAALQDLATQDGRRLFEHVADAVAGYADALASSGGGVVGSTTGQATGVAYGPVGAVVGATRGGLLRALRLRLRRSLLLVPGYGAQGGAAQDVLPAFDAAGSGAIVSSSRSLVPPPEHASAAAVAREAERRARAAREHLEAALASR